MKSCAVASVVEAVANQGVDVVALLESAGCKTGADAVDYLAQACLMRPLDAAKRQEMINQLGQLPPRSAWSKQRREMNERLRAVLVLLLCMPEHQVS